MDLAGHAGDGTPDGIQVQRVIAVPAVGRAAPHADQASLAEPRQVVGDQAWRLAGTGDNFAGSQVTSNEQADDRPAQVVGEHAEDRG